LVAFMWGGGDKGQSVAYLELHDMTFGTQASVVYIS
jgi:hypothetical protein